jgi:hypothetical protein
MQSRESLLKSLREDEKRLRELAELVGPKLRDRVEAVLKNVQARLALLELRQGAFIPEAVAGVRKESRTPAEIAVHIHGIAADGRLYRQDATTVDVSTNGARLRGVDVPLHRGCVLQLRRDENAEPVQFRVMWVAAAESEIGIQLIDTGRQIWDLPQLQMDDQYKYQSRPEDARAS